MQTKYSRFKNSYNNVMNRKNELLGMRFTTANSRLHKQMFFLLIKKCRLDRCYHCNKQIEKIEELSIEHKEAWQNSPNPKKFFWDLNNIAFSHKRCNNKKKAFPVEELLNKIHLGESTKKISRDLKICEGTVRDQKRKLLHIQGV